METFTKDPDAVLDYKNNWLAWLGTDRIIASTWTATAGITIDSDTFTRNETVVWLSGGTVGSSYTLVNRITTSLGRVDDRSIIIRINQK